MKSSNKLSEFCGVHQHLNCGVPWYILKSNIEELAKVIQFNTTLFCKSNGPKTIPFFTKNDISPNYAQDWFLYTFTRQQPSYPNIHQKNFQMKNCPWRPQWRACIFECCRCIFQAKRNPFYMSKHFKGTRNINLFLIFQIYNKLIVFGISIIQN